MKNVTLASHRIWIAALLEGGYIKGNLRGGNWVQILREVEFIREGRGGKSRRQWAHGIAIGGHSSIHGINTLELMKAPREQQASGRNVNRDRPASDPFSCTANSQRAAPPILSRAPQPIPRCPLHIQTSLLTPCLASPTLLYTLVTILYMHLYR